jgi:hypothetical protein
MLFFSLWHCLFFFFTVITYHNTYPIIVRIVQNSNIDTKPPWHKITVIKLYLDNLSLRLPMVWEPPQNQIKPYIKEKIIETTPSNPFLLFIQTKLTKWCRRPQTKPNLYLKPVLCHIKSIFHIYHKCGSSCTKLHKTTDCHSKTFPTNFKQIS